MGERTALKTKVMPEWALDRIKKFPTLYAVLHTVRLAGGSLLYARNIPGIPGPVHYNDTMLDSTSQKDVDAYCAGAQEFLGFLNRALKLAGKGWNDVAAALEVGCG